MNKLTGERVAELTMACSRYGTNSVVGFGQLTSGELSSLLDSHARLAEAERLLRDDFQRAREELATAQRERDEAQRSVDELVEDARVEAYETVNALGIALHYGPRDPNKPIGDQVVDLFVGTACKRLGELERERDQQRDEINQALDILQPAVRESGLVDACRQHAQVLSLALDNEKKATGLHDQQHERAVRLASFVRELTAADMPLGIERLPRGSVPPLNEQRYRCVCGSEGTDEHPIIVHGADCQRERASELLDETTSATSPAGAATSAATSPTAHPCTPVTEEWIEQWNAADDADGWTDAHAYHAGFAAGVKQVEYHHGIRSSPLDVVHEDSRLTRP